MMRIFKYLCSFFNRNNEPKLIGVEQTLNEKKISTEHLHRTYTDKKSITVNDITYKYDVVKYYQKTINNPLDFFELGDENNSVLNHLINLIEPLINYHSHKIVKIIHKKKLYIIVLRMGDFYINEYINKSEINVTKFSDYKNFKSVKLFRKESSYDNHIITNSNDNFKQILHTINYKEMSYNLRVACLLYLAHYNDSFEVKDNIIIIQYYDTKKKHTLIISNYKYIDFVRKFKSKIKKKHIKNK